jgi:hypothetical protein
MTTSKLLDRIKGMLKASPKKTKRSELCATIKKLKKKQKELEAKLDEASSKQDRRRLKQKIDVLRAQRQKGNKLYRKLKDGKD